MGNRLDGLPQYGVTLSGSPLNPVIENHSRRTIIAYSFETVDRNGRGPRDQPLLATSVQPTGIPDGGSLYAIGAMPENPPGPIEGLAFRTFSIAILSEPGPIITATLRSVVFEDGEFVGTSEYGDFELFTGKMQGNREVGMMAKSGEWDQVEALAPDPLPPLLGRSPRGGGPNFALWPSGSRVASGSRAETEGRGCGRTTGRNLQLTANVVEVGFGARRHRVQPLLRLGRRAGAGKSQQAPLPRAGRFLKGASAQAREIVTPDSLREFQQG